jgi:SAM-dependent methyltransferase
MGRGKARLRLPCLLLMLLGGAGIPGQTLYAAPRSQVLESWRIERDSRRFAILNTETLWDLLAVRPGMTLLDIGTGTGQFAYAFAERLKGQGKVYATDINDGCVRYVREQAAIRELKNIVPILVKKGLDEFYRSDTYDMIALFHVLMDYEKEADFLSYLRESLADDGRLILIIVKEAPDFSLQDFKDDYPGLAKVILQEPADSPFYRAFRESTRELLRAPSGAKSQAGLVEVIAEDFNLILADANFGMVFFDGSSFRKDLGFTREERDYADWLTIPNNVRGIARGLNKGTWVSARNAKIINKLLIVQKFRKYLKTNMLYTPGLSQAGKEAFTRAGYALHGEYADTIPFEDVLVYTQKRPGTDLKSAPR